jgi:hypothetical protein
MLFRIDRPDNSEKSLLRSQRGEVAVEVARPDG